jgi:uncharacterized protein (UPF0332 family)
MAFDPASFLTLAKHLFADKAALEQGRLRTVVNRGYYACVVLLIRTIEAGNHPHRAPTGRTHQWVRDALRNAKRGHVTHFKKRLEALEELRGEADYVHDRSDFAEEEVKDALDRADRLFKEIPTLPLTSIPGL